MKKYEVFISRIHKKSPFNCVGYLPEVFANNDDDVINLKEVQELINKSFGKQLNVTVYPVEETYYLKYEMSKPKAIAPASFIS